MAKSRYADKKRAGICGLAYDTRNQYYQQGARRNWPSHLSNEERDNIAHGESASRVFDTGKRHRFTEKRYIGYQHVNY